MASREPRRDARRRLAPAERGPSAATQVLGRDKTPMNLRGGGEAVRPVHRAADLWGLGARAPSTQSGAQHLPPANSAPAAPPLAALKGLRVDLAAPGHGAGEPREATGDGGEEEDEDWDEDEDSAGEIGGGAIGNLLYKAPPPPLPLIGPIAISAAVSRPPLALPRRASLPPPPRLQRDGGAGAQLIMGLITGSVS